jgi:hypothetical protein
MLRIPITIVAICALAWADAGGGLHWTAPAQWKAEPGTRPMRVATYTVPAAPGDNEASECVAYYFGKGQGGSVEANIQRWTSQFQDRTGQPVRNAQVKKSTVHGLPVTTMDVSGAYAGMGGPMAASKSVKPGYRMLAAIVEGPQGAVFFKFTGPAKTVGANQKAFDGMIASVGKQ